MDGENCFGNKSFVRCQSLSNDDDRYIADDVKPPDQILQVVCRDDPLERLFEVHTQLMHRIKNKVDNWALNRDN